MATGRSDYPNQVNNVLGFPYIFRGALDVRATTINDGDEDRRRQALAELAREDVPDEVAAAYQASARNSAGLHHPGAVRSAPHLGVPVGRREGRDGHRRRAPPIADMEAIRSSFRNRRDPIAGVLQRVYERCAASRSASSSPRARKSR
jgi:malate dehydrogenase (oxaloacetate-decarboxylating)(NADP+)